MSTWAVTLKTGDKQWSTIKVEAADHFAAIADAKRLLGNYPVSEVV